jgi:hypothetical protein
MRWWEDLEGGPAGGVVSLPNMPPGLDMLEGHGPGSGNGGQASLILPRLYSLPSAHPFRRC